MGSTNFFQLYSWWEILKNACERKEVLKVAKENSLTNVFHGFEHPGNLVKWFDLQLTLHKKCPCSDLFWSTFFPHFPVFGLNMERYGVFSQNGGKCGKNADQDNSEYGHFLRSVQLTTLFQEYFLSLCTNFLLVYKFDSK